MKQRIRMILASLGIISGVALAGAGPVALAVDPGFGACSGNNQSAVCKARSTDGAYTILRSVITILLTVIGIIGVIMIVIGGIKYTTSGGDQNQVSSAKNTIIYAVVGIVIAVMSFAIVNFVLDRIGK